jgi:DNA repair exonuclease SbcCD nuclease subunit
VIRFLHTADLQIGKPFAGFDGDPGAALRARRITVLADIARVATTHAADFVVVAGDLFDANTVDARTVEGACRALAELPCPAFVLPGNHDAGDIASVYRSRRFERARPPNVHVLLTPEPTVVAGGRAVLLPAPLLRRHVFGDPAFHMTAEFGRDVAPNAVRIGVAHGGVRGFASDPDAAPNLLPVDLAQRAALDYLALGDWHGTLRIDERTWYSGTPEPDRHKRNAPGAVLLVTLTAPGATPHVERVETAHFRWLAHEARLADASDVEQLRRWFDAVDAPGRAIVDLALTGSLDVDARQQLDELLDEWRGRLHVLAVEADVDAMPTDAQVDAVAGEGYLRAAVDELRARAGGVDADAEIARHALTLLATTLARARPS